MTKDQERAGFYIGENNDSVENEILEEISANQNGIASEHKHHSTGDFICLHNDTKDNGSSQDLSETTKGMKRNLSRHEVPMLFREPHVEYGFRPLHQPWSYYFLSIFSLHNESMNVWTHLFAVILMVRKVYLFSHDLDFINDPHTWPLLSGMICGIIMYFCSSFAHCCQSKSEFVHYVAFMIDYSGIGLYGLGSVILHESYCSKDNFFYMAQPFFIPVGCVLAFLICLCCTIAKVRYTRPYPFTRKIWQMAPVAGVYALLISPIVHRLYSCYMHGLDCNDSINYHIQQIFCFMLSGFFFASDIPQKWHPGKCDYFMHSHQLFHIAIAVCILTQIDGVMIDFLTREDIIRSRPEPSFASAFGPVMCVVFLEIVSVLLFANKLYKKLNECIKSEESQKKEK